MVSQRPADSYSPLYFLTSVGAGGLAVTFFMYLMFWVPHPGRAVPIFEDLTAVLAAGLSPRAVAVAIAMLGIAVFGAMNLGYLVWNLRRVGHFRRSETGETLMGTNARTQVMALPLALAMAINAGFILGLTFVPGLWGVVEYLFPVALAAFAAVGVLALSQLGAFLRDAIAHNGFDTAANNSFAQLLPAFTLAMIGVGLSAPSAMSVTPLTAGISVILSTFFLVAAVVVALAAVILGLQAMLEHGVQAEQAPTILIVIPLLTVLGILLVRQNHGLHVHFESHSSPGDMLVMLTRLLSVQLLFGLLGLTVLRAQGYMRRFVFGERQLSGAYALICPGVALSVMGHFWINKGLVAAGLIEKFGAAYWALTALALAAQVAMIWLMLVLNRHHFGRAPGAPVPAE